MKTILTILATFIILSCTTPRPEIVLEESIINYSEFDELTIPMKLDAGIFPYIELNIQDKIIPLYIDTGSNSSINLSPSQYEDLIYEETKYEETSINIQGKFKSSILKIKNVTIGDIHLEHVMVGTDNMIKPPFLSDFGRIGWNFFNKFNVLIDYRSQVIKLYNINLNNDNEFSGWNKIMLKKKNDKAILFSTEISNETELTCMIDTGALMLGENEVYNLLLYKSLDEELLKNDQEITESKRMIIKDISLKHNNAVIIEDFMVLDISNRATKGIDIILGGDFMLNNKVYINNNTKTLFYIEY